MSPLGPYKGVTPPPPPHRATTTAATLWAVKSGRCSEVQTRVNVWAVRPPKKVATVESLLLWRDGH